MSRGAWLGIFAITIVTCAVTVPDKAKHTSAIAEKSMAQARRSGVAGAVGAGLMGGIAEGVIGGLLEYNSYVIASTTRAPDGTTVSVGALGQVFVVVDLTRPRGRKK